MLYRISASYKSISEKHRLSQELLDEKCLQLLRAMIHNEIVLLPKEWESNVRANKGWVKSVTVTFTYETNILIPKTTAYKRWNCHVIRPANCCHLIPSNRFLGGYPDLCQFAVAKLAHYIHKVAVNQESKLFLHSRTSNIQNFTTVRKYLHQGKGGGLFILIHKSINFSRRP